MAGDRPVGLVVGSVVAIAFGLVFVEVNSGGLPGGWPLGIRVGGAVVAVALLVALAFAARRAAAAPDTDHRGFVDQRYWRIVGFEGIALFVGLVLLNGVLDWPQVAVAWIAVVVGVHFVGLAKLWHMDLYLVLGAVMTVLGVAGFVLGAAGTSAATIGLVSGVLSGVALFASVGVALARTAAG
ncbi:hypothetical protein [Actinophytocola gossypii]|uniref:Tripartite tricarboxylate transporter TctB family protein n=1 Tax=Actinophytocola gossypii TaxID=2812003 RepID=A0ABT2J4V1_9PSEU|nr:hypothetical protein [Actinophytocola gossypii]MCT2582892.1 hypothetical protein [Actinophytocola gossypii]